jgi:hypothetical protein
MCLGVNLLPQLSHAIPTVNAAVAAFGVCYELHVYAEDRLVAVNGHEAIRNRTSEFTAGHFKSASRISAPPVNLCHACFRRAHAAPTAQCFNTSAGSFQNFVSLGQDMVKLQFFRWSGADSHSWTYGCRQQLTLRMMISVFCFRLLTCRPPGTSLDVRLIFLRPYLTSPETPSRQFASVSEAEARLLPLLHSCYHFTARATAFKYLPHAPSASDLLLEQGHHLALLSH